ncbi:cytochrome P450 [Micromonospora sp. STR1_7]|uniref:Cytochrome P450 n=1 Tax=Micromonospora parastrephiae TaxID=2806101 RepID=A0ABS1XTI2_9ACTN|nr:cytochrome P450 [Micromonospora parastrephiae]MBM0232576.1 cytochrome P450 [Micromonospora parastrephiae]
MSGTPTSQLTPPVLDDFDPYNPIFRADPYPEYERIRAVGGPVYWEYLDSYLIASHADATAVLAEPGLRVQPPPEVAEMLLSMVPTELHPMQQTLLFQDPPDHTRLRNLTRRAFSSSAIAGVLAEGRHTARAVLDRAVRSGRLEVVDDLAFPVSLQVIGDLLGVPRSDLPLLKEWGQALSPAADIPAAAGSLERALEGFQAFDDYFGRLAERRRRDPGDDLFSALVQAEAEGVISRDELHANAILTFISGHETLVAFAASAFLCFLRRPDQLTLLRQRPELAANAVDEVLRYESPLQLATAGGGRWTQQDLLVGDHVIPAGQRVLVLLGAANRDPAVYPDPDRFDIVRPAYRHLSLGHGLHFCVGAVLARQQGSMILEELAATRAEFEATLTELDWMPLFMQRRLAALPLRVDPR